MTENLDERLKRHNAGDGARTPSRKEGWESIYFDGYLNKNDALGREKFLKSGSGRMVASHDNLILGIQTNDPLHLALIDADRIWVMHFISFWKDFASETGHAEDLSSQDLFKIRQPQFYNNIIPHTSLAKQWQYRHFKKRLKEIRSEIMQDRSIFQKYAEKTINSKTG